MCSKLQGGACAKKQPMVPDAGGGPLNIATVLLIADGDKCILTLAVGSPRLPHTKPTCSPSNPDENSEGEAVQANVWYTTAVHCT